jgi:signal transduction histidine kinase
MHPTERDLALQLLVDESPERRLEGVRLMRLVGEPADEPVLRHALAVETVSWIRHALIEAIDQIDANQELDAGEVGPPPGDWDSISTVIQEVVHELSHVVARMRLTLGDEPDLALPAVSRECDRLASFLEALRILHATTVDYRSETFDLSTLLLNVAEAHSREYSANIDLLGASPCLVVGSRVLVEVIAQNALRNAVEANLSAGHSLDPIIVSWARTPRQSWFSILDAGVGPSKHVSKLFRMGATTKPGHAGMGLAICAHAARRFGGELRLEQGTSGGGRFELRWLSI